MLNREKVNIRDPYILLHEGIYYLYVWFSRVLG